jgi:hypothetical protein
MHYVFLLAVHKLGLLVQINVQISWVERKNLRSFMAACYSLNLSHKTRTFPFR